MRLAPLQDEIIFDLLTVLFFPKTCIVFYSHLYTDEGVFVRNKQDVDPEHCYAVAIYLACYHSVLPGRPDHPFIAQ